MVSCCFPGREVSFIAMEATAMVLGKVFDRFAQCSPVTVMMRGIMEYVVPPERLDEIFREQALQVANAGDRQRQEVERRRASGVA
jgi:hypothetical protein